MELKESIKAVLPPVLLHKLKTTRRLLTVYLESFIDATRHSRYGAPDDDLFDPSNNLMGLECQMTKDYHRVEKGLALLTPRQPFGAAVRKRLQSGIEVLDRAEGHSSFADYARSALSALDTWNNTGHVDPHISPEASADEVWGTFEPEQAKALLKHFFASRRSVRNFDMDRNVSLDVVKEAVKLASFTPSVCNRQSWRIHLCTEPSTVSAVIRHQNGNAGFGDRVPMVAVVTTDTRLFSGPGERNQRWVDGGLFAMSFVYGLHAQGLATCMLNWSMSNRMSNVLRSSAGISQYEDIITLVAIGYAPPTFRIARSPRRPQEEVLIVHKSDQERTKT